MSFSLRAHARPGPRWADLIVALIVAVAAVIVALASASAARADEASAPALERGL
jgi:hypothetical protein